MKPKINPHRRPATQADVEKARVDGVEQGLRLAVYAAIKRMEAEDVPADDIRAYASAVMDVCDSIVKGYIKWADIEKTLTEEYGIEVKLK